MARPTVYSATLCFLSSYRTKTAHHTIETTLGLAVTRFGDRSRPCIGEGLRVSVLKRHDRHRISAVPPGDSFAAQTDAVIESPVLGEAIQFVANANPELTKSFQVEDRLVAFHVCRSWKHIRDEVCRLSGPVADAKRGHGV